MISIGIVRKVDELGRIVIPKETREQLNIAIKDPLEIFTDDETIVLKKYQPGCGFSCFPGLFCIRSALHLDISTFIAALFIAKSG